MASKTVTLCYVGPVAECSLGPSLVTDAPIMVRSGEQVKVDEQDAEWLLKRYPAVLEEVKSVPPASAVRFAKEADGSSTDEDSAADKSRSARVKPKADDGEADSGDAA